VDCTPGIAAALREAGVAVAWLFGSRAAGTAQAGSDVDIAVHSARGLPPPGLLALSRLARALEPHLPGPADLTDFERAPLELRARIVLTGRVLHSDDEPLRVRVTVDTQSRWEDVRPALEKMDRAYLAAVAARGGSRG
jgi:predicted nucleotidyltransferase